MPNLLTYTIDLLATTIPGLRAANSDRRTNIPSLLTDIANMRANNSTQNSDRHIDIPSRLADIASIRTNTSTEITAKAFGRWGKHSC